MRTADVTIERRRYRAATEDRAAVVDHAHGRVIVVADGVGGRSGGARAADLLVAIVARQVPTLATLDEASTWCGLLESVDAELRADPSAGETTAVVVAVTAEGLAGAAVGDSEAWVVPAVGPPRVLAGRKRRKPYLGYGAAMPESFAASAWSGTLLVASDGLFKYADPDAIAAAARLPTLASAAAALAELPRSRTGGSYDDDLVIVVARTSDG